MLETLLLRPSVHCTQLHFTSLHLLTLYLFPFQLHPTTLHFTSFVGTSLLPITTSPSYTSLQYTCWHFTSSHFNFTQLHFTTLSFGLTPENGVSYGLQSIATECHGTLCERAASWFRFCMCQKICSNVNFFCHFWNIWLMLAALYTARTLGLFGFAVIKSCVLTDCILIVVYGFQCLWFCCLWRCYPSILMATLTLYCSHQIRDDNTPCTDTVFCFLAVRLVRHASWSAIPQMPSLGSTSQQCEYSLFITEVISKGWHCRKVQHVEDLNSKFTQALVLQETYRLWKSSLS